MNQLNNYWYRPGNWSLPRWWIDGVPVRNGKASTAQQATFYDGAFVRNVLGHKGGITTLPRS